MARTNQTNHSKGRQTSLLRDQRGLSTVEYIIILVLIAVGGLAGWKLMGDGVVARIDGSNKSIDANLKVPGQD